MLRLKKMPAILQKKITEIVVSWYWKFISRVHLRFSQHGFKRWLIAEQVTIHYLNLWWNNLLTHICVTWLELITMHILSICIGYKEISVALVTYEFETLPQSLTINASTHFLIKVLSWKGRIHVCLSKLTTIGSDNGLLPGWHQATNLSEIIIEKL